MVRLWKGDVSTQQALMHLASPNSLTTHSLLVQLGVTSYGVGIAESTINSFYTWWVVLLLEVSNWHAKRAFRLFRGNDSHLRKHTHGQRQEFGAQSWWCLRNIQKFYIPVWEGAWRRYIAMPVLARKTQARAVQGDSQPVTSVPILVDWWQKTRGISIGWESQTEFIIITQLAFILQLLSDRWNKWIEALPSLQRI